VFWISEPPWQFAQLHSRLATIPKKVATLVLVSKTNQVSAPLAATSAC
jgi:hypothetical protein